MRLNTDRLNDPAGAAKCALGVALLAAIAVLYAAAGHIAAAAAFLVLAAAYFFVSSESFSTVTVDGDGAARSLFGRVERLPWESVREVGILPPGGVRRARGAVKLKKCRLYYSPRALTSYERYRACMSTPKGVIAAAYTVPRMRETLEHWPKTIVLFNATAKELFGSGADAAELDLEEDLYQIGAGGRK